MFARPLFGILALGTLSLAACNQGQLIDVQFAAVGATTPTAGGPGGTPTPTPTSLDSPTPGTPTPTPGPTPMETPAPSPSPTSTPATGPELTCGTVTIRSLMISDPAGPTILYRDWATLTLASPDASSLNGLGVTPGTYKRVQFVMAEPVGIGSPGPGTGNPAVNGSLHICGVAQGIPFEVFDDVTTTVDRQDPGGVTAGAGGPGVLFVDFDSTHWLDGIDLTRASLTNGVAYLNHASNLQMAMEFKQNFVNSVHLADQAHR